MTITLISFLEQTISNPALFIITLLTLGVILVNGWTDAPNAIATCVSTRSMGPGSAILMAAVFNFLGVLIMTLINGYCFGCLMRSAVRHRYMGYRSVVVRNTHQRKPCPYCRYLRSSHRPPGRTGRHQSRGVGKGIVRAGAVNRNGLWGRLAYNKRYRQSICKYRSKEYFLLI